MTSFKSGYYTRENVPLNSANNTSNIIWQYVVICFGKRELILELLIISLKIILSR